MKLTDLFGIFKVDKPIPSKEEIRKAMEEYYVEKHKSTLKNA